MNIQKNLYIVEKIIGRKKLKSGAVFYKIKWKDWPIQQCTWEPLKHLQFVKGLVSRYDQYLEKRKLKLNKQIKGDQKIKQNQEDKEGENQEQKEKKGGNEAQGSDNKLASGNKNTKIKKIRKVKNQNPKNSKKTKSQNEKQKNKLNQQVINNSEQVANKLENQQIKVNLQKIAENNKKQKVQRIKRKYVRKPKVEQKQAQQKQSDIKNSLNQFKLPQQLIEQKFKQNQNLIQQNEKEKSEQKNQIAIRQTKQPQEKMNQVEKKRRKPRDKNNLSRKLRKKIRKLQLSNRIFELNLNPYQNSRVQQKQIINDKQKKVILMQPPFLIQLIQREQNKLRQEVVVILQEESGSFAWQQQCQNDLLIMKQPSQRLIGDLRQLSQSPNLLFSKIEKKYSIQKNQESASIYANKEYQHPDQLKSDSIIKDSKFPPQQPSSNKFNFQQNNIKNQEKKNSRRRRNRKLHPSIVISSQYKQKLKARKKRSFAEIFVNDNNQDKFPHIFKTQISHRQQPIKQSQQQVQQVQQIKLSLTQQLQHFQPSNYKNSLSNIIHFNNQRKLNIQLINQQEQKCVFQVNQIKKYFPVWLKQFYEAFI